jgi:type II secretory pathway pseudopilin PulG
MKVRITHSLSLAQRSSAFTLLEVIVACAIFFLVAFAVLQLVSGGIAAARKLQQREPDFGVLAAELTLTNQLVEGSDSGDFEDMFPGLYRGYSWSRDILEVYSNGFFRVDFVIYHDAVKGAQPRATSVFFYKPGSPPGSASKGP